MIFVSVGTNEARFDRLLRAVAELPLDEELLIQHGHSSPVPAPTATLVDFLSFEEMVEAMRNSRVVVTHAGVGSVMVALSNGKRPVVVPRRKALGEAVDDHQLQLGRRFAQAGLVTLVESTHTLGSALAGAQEAATIAPSASALAADLTTFLEASIRRPLSAAHA
jgi:UDP-N-acetylglucosamine--N-acetylmuramyl-(pentapeptide) pyrophosphoryl-undecaprenol N-acetylglucosamine transferase